MELIDKAIQHGFQSPEGRRALIELQFEDEPQAKAKAGRTDCAPKSAKAQAREKAEVEAAAFAERIRIARKSSKNIGGSSRAKARLAIVPFVITCFAYMTRLLPVHYYMTSTLFPRATSATPEPVRRQTLPASAARRQSITSVASSEPTENSDENSESGGSNTLP